MLPERCLLSPAALPAPVSSGMRVLPAPPGPDEFASILQPLAREKRPDLVKPHWPGPENRSHGKTTQRSIQTVLQTFVKLGARPSRHEAAHLRRVPDPPQDVEPVDPMQMPEQRAVLADRLLPAAALHARRQVKQMLAVSPCYCAPARRVVILVTRCRGRCTCRHPNRA